MESQTGTKSYYIKRNMETETLIKGYELKIKSKDDLIGRLVRLLEKKSNEAESWQAAYHELRNDPDFSWPTEH